MALHKIGAARQVLYDVLAPLLDEGRVAAYPPAQNVGVQVWIDEHRGNTNTRSSAVTIDVDFPIHATYDGTDEAQVAGLDDLISRIWDACEAADTVGITPTGWAPAASITVAGGSRRHSIVTVRYTIGARTLCSPDAPGASPIPPDKTQE